MNRKNSNPSAVSSGIFFTGSVDITINAHTNNLSTDVSNFVVIRVTPSANYDITGLVPPDITLGWYVLLYNVGTIGNSLTLKNNSASSTSTNRFLLGSDKNLQPDEGVALVYDVVSQRWRSFGINI